MLLTVLGIYEYSRNAFAYREANIGESKLYENGYAYVTIDGPLGTDRLGIKFTNLDYKSCKVATFNDTSHNIQVEGSGSGNGVYHTSIDVQKVKTRVNSNTGAYTYIDFVIKYDIPAHEEYSKEAKDGIAYKFSTGGRFQTQAVHQTKNRSQVSLKCTTSVSTVGLATIDQKRYSHSVLTLYLKNADRKIKYNGNGNDVNLEYTTKTFTDGSNYTFPIAERKGYTFINWKDENDKEITKDTLVCSANTLYAQWKANQYTIHYDSNGGNGSMDDTTVTYDNSLTLPKNKFTKDGYQFLGWSKIKGNDVAAYEDEDTFTYQTDSDMTLYAVWGNGQYKVNLQPNGADGDAKIVPLTYGQQNTLPKNTYARKGYTFIGWNSDPDAVSIEYADEQKVTDLADAGKTKKLYAVWRKSDGSFDTINVIHDESMFTGNINIQGENETGYSYGHTDSEYARIDKSNTPGYFTNRYK